MLFIVNYVILLLNIIIIIDTWGRKKMQNTDYYSSFHGIQSPLTKINRLENSSNKILRKNADGSILGMHYRISSEPSRLRPVKSWIIHIEEWSCNADSTMTAKDILFIRILNHPQHEKNHQDLITEIVVGDLRTDLTIQNTRNAMAAALVVISKIDAGRMPDINEIFKLYNLT